MRDLEAIKADNAAGSIQGKPMKSVARPSGSDPYREAVRNQRNKFEANKIAAIHEAEAYRHAVVKFAGSVAAVCETSPPFSLQLPVGFITEFRSALDGNDAVRVRNQLAALQALLGSIYDKVRSYCQGVSSSYSLRRHKAELLLLDTRELAERAGFWMQLADDVLREAGAEA